jgi:intraflagellar transport protein 140
MDMELLTLALECDDTKARLDSAKYFEDNDMADKAVLLYQKAGQVNKAVEMCFKANLFESLKTIADGLTEDTDPALLARCGEFFLTNQNFDKAVQLLTLSKNYKKALKVCLDRNVALSEELCDKMTPAKPSGKDEKEKKAWEDTVITIRYIISNYSLLYSRFVPWLTRASSKAHTSSLARSTPKRVIASGQ